MKNKKGKGKDIAKCSRVAHLHNLGLLRLLLKSSLKTMKRKVLKAIKVYINNSFI